MLVQSDHLRHWKKTDWLEISPSYPSIRQGTRGGESEGARQPHPTVECSRKRRGGNGGVLPDDTSGVARTQGESGGDYSDPRVMLF